MPAKAGIQNYLKTLDSRLRGNDAKGRFKTFLRNHHTLIVALYEILIVGTVFNRDYPFDFQSVFISWQIHAGYPDLHA